MPRFDDLLILPDPQFFARFDLEQKDLATVRRAVDRTDYPAARRALLQYYADLPDTPFGPMPPLKESAAWTTPDGQRALDHRVSVWGREVRLPADIPWLRPDLSHPYRGDYHVVSQLNDHGLIHRLIDAYRQTGNPAYARHAVDLMQHWLRTCTPFPVAGHALSGDREHVWYNPAHSTRVQYWCHAFYALRHAPCVTDDQRIALLKTIFREQEYKRHDYQGNPNHIIAQLLGFVRFYSWWPQSSAARAWAVEALAELRQCLDDFFYDDGAYVELCYLHLNDFVQACRLAEEWDLPIAADFAKKTARTFDFPLYALHPCGGYPPFNDAGGNTDESAPLPVTRGGLIELGARFSGRPDLRYANTWGRQGAAPAHCSHHFDHAGFFVMRSDWSAQARYLMMDGGRNLGGCQHPHMDQLSFVLAAYGHTLVTDTGYGGPWMGRWRQEYYAATPGHNAIAVDGQWQAQYPEENPKENNRWPARPMIGNLWSVSPGRVARGIAAGPPPGNRWHSDPHFDYARSTYDQGFTRQPLSKPAERLAVRHERRMLFFKPDYWVMTDLLHGQGEHNFESYFHFPATVSVTQDDEGLTIDHLAARLRLIPLCRQPVRTRIVRGQHEPIQGWLPGKQWGEHIPAPTAVLSGTVHLPLTLHTVLYPSPADQEPQVRAALLEETDRALEIHHKGRRDLYYAGAQPIPPLSLPPWHLSGEVSALRLDAKDQVHSRLDLPLQPS